MVLLFRSALSATVLPRAVSSTAELRDALMSPSVDTVWVNNTLDIDKSEWGDTLLLNRPVTISATPERLASSTYVRVNFNEASMLLQLSPGITLTFVGLEVRAQLTTGHGPAQLSTDRGDPATRRHHNPSGRSKCLPTPTLTLLLYAPVGLAAIQGTAAALPHVCFSSGVAQPLFHTLLLQLVRALGIIGPLYLILRQSINSTLVLDRCIQRRWVSHHPPSHPCRASQLRRTSDPRYLPASFKTLPARPSLLRPPTTPPCSQPNPISTSRPHPYPSSHPSQSSTAFVTFPLRGCPPRHAGGPAVHRLPDQPTAGQPAPGEAPHAPKRHAGQ